MLYTISCIINKKLLKITKKCWNKWKYHIIYIQRYISLAVDPYDYVKDCIGVGLQAVVYEPILTMSLRQENTL